MPFHHVAYATRDIEATIGFYEGLMGFPLVYTEVQGTGTSWVRHIFFDIGGGECLAFFEINDVGERPGFPTDVSHSVGLPVWVTHAAFRATEDQQLATKARMAEAGVSPLMELDHGWCVSHYYTDPSGIMVELCRDRPGFAAAPAEAHRLAAADPLELIGDGVAGRSEPS